MLAKHVRKTTNCFEYLEGRGISKATAEAFGVCDAVVWSHDENRELPAIAFPYKRDGELLQVKRIGIERPNGKKSSWLRLTVSLAYLVGRQCQIMPEF